MDHLNFPYATSKAIQNTELFNFHFHFHVECVVEFSHLVTFLEMVRYCWHAETDYLKLFTDTFRLTFQMLIYNCRWTLSTTLTIKTRYPLRNFRIQHRIIRLQFENSDHPLIMSTEVREALWLSLDSWKKKFKRISFLMLKMRGVYKF